MSPSRISLAALLLVAAAALFFVTFTNATEDHFMSDEEFDEFMDLMSDSEASLSNGQSVKATTTVNIRSGPCDTNSKIGSLSTGQTATYTGSTKSGCGYTWYSVKGSFGNGWVASKYVTEVSGGGGGGGSTGNGKINQRGVDLIKSFEGWYSCKYKDPVGLWTIGYGHLIKSGETFNHCLTHAEGESLLRRDISGFESCVNKNVKVSLTSNQFSALVSFSFNVGCGGLQSSTLLRLLNGGDRGAVCGELKKWTKAGGKTLPGLVRRRDAECDLFRA